MWPKRSYVLDPLTESDSGTKGSKIIWKNLEVAFKDIKIMASDDTLFNCIDYTIPLLVPTDASDKNVDDVISKNNKPIAFFLGILINP